MSTFGTNAVFTFILILLIVIIIALFVGFISPAAGTKTAVLTIASKATALQKRFNAFTTQVENTEQRAAELTSRSANIEGKLPYLACGFVEALLKADALGLIQPPFTFQQLEILSTIVNTQFCIDAQNNVPPPLAIAN